MPISETQLLAGLLDQVQSRLPAGWTASMHREPARRGPDALLTVRGPNGTASSILVEAKARSTTQDISGALRQLKSYRETGPYMVMAPFLPEGARRMLTEAGAGYADGSGNLRIVLDSPALVMELSGADRNPWPEPDEPLRSLKGRAAGRVVRAVCDFRPPYGVRELAERSKTPVASVWRVLSLLERESLITRETAGDARRPATVVYVDWRGVVRRWTKDYGLTRSNQTQLFLAPRGLHELLERLRKSRVNYAITGSLAAVRVEPVAPARLGAIYVDDMLAAQQALDLRAAEAGANVLLAEPFDPVVFERTWEKEGLQCTALSQVTADLLTGPGRSAAEAEALVEWMARNEDAWRS